MRRVFLSLFMTACLCGVATAKDACSAEAINEKLRNAPQTKERLKLILSETIKENPGKSNAEIVKIFEGRKKKFAESLKEQASKFAKENCNPPTPSTVAH